MNERLRALCSDLDRQLLPLSCYLLPMKAGWRDGNGKLMAPPFGGHEAHLRKLLEEAEERINDAKARLDSQHELHQGNGG